MISLWISLINFVFGYTLQSLGCALAIHTLNRRRISPGGFALMVLFFSIATLIIRKISIINFGFHTILVVISCILISIIIYRFPIYTTALAMLLSIISIMAFEMLNVMLMTLLIGNANITRIMAAAPNTLEYFYKTLIGIPTNIFLVLAMGLAYILSHKKHMEPDSPTTVSNWIFNKNAVGDINEWKK